MREIGTTYISISKRNLQIIKEVVIRFNFFNRAIKKFTNKKRVRGPTLKKKHKVYLL